MPEIPEIAARAGEMNAELRGKAILAVEDILIGYREGQPCPVCSTPIQKIKTGGTSSFICPVCQKL